MLTRAVAILLSLSLLPMTQALCVAGYFGGACECEASGECGRDCGCAGESTGAVVVENAVASRPWLAVDVLMAAGPALCIDEPQDYAVRIPLASCFAGPPRHLPFPVSDVPLLI